MKRSLFAGNGTPATTGGAGMPKNHGWHTVTEPDTMPEQDFQVKGELGSEAPPAMATALANPMIAGTLHAGDRVLLTAFGGGLTWGSAVLTWPELDPTTRRSP